MEYKVIAEDNNAILREYEDGTLLAIINDVYVWLESKEEFKDLLKYEEIQWHDDEEEDDEDWYWWWGMCDDDDEEED